MFLYILMFVSNDTGELIKERKFLRLWLDTLLVRNDTTGLKTHQLKIKQAAWCSTMQQKLKLLFTAEFLNISK